MPHTLNKLFTVWRRFLSRVSRWSNISLNFVRDEAAGELRSLVDSFVHSLSLAAVCHPCVTLFQYRRSTSCEMKPRGNRALSSIFSCTHCVWRRSVSRVSRWVRDEAAGEPRSLVDSFVQSSRLFVISCIIIPLTRHSLGLLSHAHSLINVVSVFISLQS